VIVGVGIDLIDVSRVARSVERFGKRFLQRIYHARELEQTRGDRVQYLAARFAAKEAVFKALGTGEPQGFDGSMWRCRIFRRAAGSSTTWTGGARAEGWARTATISLSRTRRICRRRGGP